MNVIHSAHANFRTINRILSWFVKKVFDELGSFGICIVSNCYVTKYFEML